MARDAVIFVFDKTFHTVPNQGHLCSGFYHQKTQYMSNVANGNIDDGILGHGSLFIDMFASNIPYDTISTDDITTETDLFYLIEPWPLFNGIKHHPGMSNIANPIGWAMALRYIPKRITELANEGRLTILYHIPEFVFGLHIIQDNISTELAALNVPELQFKFVSGLRTDKWYYWPGFEYSQLLCYKSNWNVIKEINVGKRNKKYTCLNRIDKIHRRYLALLLFDANLHTNGYFSYSFGEFTYNGLETASIDAVPHGTAGDWPISESWSDFYNAGPWTADELTIDEHNNHWHVEQQHYNDAYWNFVTETGITMDTFLSEKTFKPIANLQPFIIFGSHNTLATLRDLGYKTFSDYIDESYDLIEDPQERVKAAGAQALRLANMSHDDHIALIKQLTPILEHNQQHFFRPKSRINNFVKYIQGNNPKYNWLKDCNYD